MLAADGAAAAGPEKLARECMTKKRGCREAPPLVRSSVAPPRDQSRRRRAELRSRRRPHEVERTADDLARHRVVVDRLERMMAGRVVDQRQRSILRHGERRQSVSLEFILGESRPARTLEDRQVGPKRRDLRARATIVERRRLDRRASRILDRGERGSDGARRREQRDPVASMPYCRACVVRWTSSESSSPSRARDGACAVPVPGTARRSGMIATMPAAAAIVPTAAPDRSTRAGGSLSTRARTSNTG